MRITIYTDDGEVLASLTSTEGVDTDESIRAARAEGALPYRIGSRIASAIEDDIQAAVGLIANRKA